MKQLLPTPRQLGFQMPAEWRLQDATWLAWPDHAEIWECDLEPVRETFAKLAAELSPDQYVEILVNSEEAQRDAETRIARNGGTMPLVRFHNIPTDDCWMRDSGPTFVFKQSPKQFELAGVCWRFTSWGEKYPWGENDAEVSRRVTDALEVPFFLPGIVFEGGSIDVNGAGTVLTTEQCLLNPNRNPGLDRENLEKLLCEYLNVDRVVWLGDGIVGDDTDGHVDDITRFVSESVMITAVESDPNDENYRPLQDNLKRLHSAKDPNGKPFEVLQLPMPDPVHWQGRRLPASYANFYIGNRKVIMPTFGSPKDKQAADILQKIFPKRKVVGISALELVTGNGSFHCVTQQQPASTLE